MDRILDAETEAITINLAGTFEPSEDLYAMAERAADLNERIITRTKADGGLRPDVVVDDLSLILEQVSSIRVWVTSHEHASSDNATSPVPGRPRSVGEPLPALLRRRWSSPRAGCPRTAADPSGD